MNFKKMRLNFKVFIFVFYFFNNLLHADWGFFAHKKINEMAIYTLPEEMLIFFKLNWQLLIDKAVAADQRRGFVLGEDSKHYIDLDRYTQKNIELPKKWNQAIDKIPEDTLHAHGIGPWNLLATYKKLVYAFLHKNPEQILKYAADLGHYCGDLHVPLHTTENYNGQLTGQRGIHGLWESRLPELFAKDYDFFFEPIVYIPDVLEKAWATVYASHAQVEKVLKTEKKLQNKYKDIQKSYERKGNTVVRVYSEKFCEHYHQALDGMVEKQMRAAIYTLGSLWYSAWIDAGQPNLTALFVDSEKILNLDEEESVNSNSKTLKSREDE